MAERLVAQTPAARPRASPRQPARSGPVAGTLPDGRVGAGPAPDARMLLALQRGAGNRAAGLLVRERTRPAVGSPSEPAPAAAPAPETTSPTETGSPEPAAPVSATVAPAGPAEPAAREPAADPRFAAVAVRVASAARTARAHPPVGTEVADVHAAAQPPADDREAQAKTAALDALAAARPAGFDKAAFIAAVGAAVARAAPVNLDEADRFADSGRAEAVKTEVMTGVIGGVHASAAPLEASAQAPPDPSHAVEKPVEPLEEAAPSPLPPAEAGAAMPAPAPPERTDLRAGPARITADLDRAGVTEVHLRASNEPQMIAAADSSQAARDHAETAPARVRAQEAAILERARGQADASAAAGLDGMAASRAGALGQVLGAKTGGKGREEAERARIATALHRIYDTTKADVQGRLDALGEKVAGEFDAGAGAAQAAFTAEHEAGMAVYKDERYSGPTGWARWTADQFTGLPEEASGIYERAKAGFERRMNALITRIADLVATELDAVTARAAAGRAEAEEYVAAQPEALRQVAAEAGGQIAARFDGLDADIQARQSALVDDLAGRYAAATEQVDAEITAERERNRGLVDHAVDAVTSSLAAIARLKDLFTGLLARAAGAFTAVLAAPVRFIENFMGAVKAGFLGFARNIGAHLRSGLMGWLFGALAAAGIRVPESFDARGILGMVTSAMGLTWEAIKGRLVKLEPRIRPVIDVIADRIELFQVLATRGVEGIWELLAEKLEGLKESLLEPIKEFIVEKVVKAGITWILGLLNPAGALIKIVQALINVVTWIIERGAGLVDLVRTVVGAVSDIAAGGVGGVPAKIEASLGKAVPLVISFLARLLGLGGISAKIREVITTIQAPVARAVDSVLRVGLRVARPMIDAAARLGGRLTSAWTKGKRIATGAAERGRAFLARLIRKPFTVDGERHTVKAAPVGGGYRLSIASRERSVPAHQQAAATEARKKQRPELAKEALDLIAEAARIEALPSDTPEQQARTQAAVAEFAELVRRVWQRIGYQGVPPREIWVDEADPKGIVGEVGPYKDQGTGGYRGADTRPSRERVWKEHVIPYYMIRDFVRGYLKIWMSTESGKEPVYRSMPTVMIYHGAHLHKDYRGKNRDLRVVAKLQSLMAGTKDKLRNPEAVANAVRASFDGVMASRIRILKEARDLEHAQSGRTGPVAPSDAAIETAALQQLLVVTEFLAQAGREDVEAGAAREARERAENPPKSRKSRARSGRTPRT